MNSHDESVVPDLARRTPIELLRIKLKQAGITEARLIRWLKEVEAIPGGTPGLQCISPKRLAIIVENWDSVRQNF
jgi:hypothetical protein